MIGRVLLPLMAAFLLSGCGVIRHAGLTSHHAASVRAPADVEAAYARRALGKRDGASAIVHAEAAVASNGHDAALRALLGAAYLRGGRFASAAQACEDALALNGDDGPSALNLTLARIATGEWDRAVEVLTDHAASIPAADRGLALALAGRPQDGVAVLMAAMRVPGADARTRQNLALALALAGDWSDSYLLLSLDLDAKAARARVLEWMRFAQPRTVSDQVAALLKVTPVVDPGQPVALALVRPATVVAVAAFDAPLPLIAPAPPGHVTASTYNKASLTRAD